jgi:hypothetical protein
MGMSPSSAEHYRGRAEDCCRNAIISENVERRLHWLEAAARWISLARQEGILPPRPLGQDATASNDPPKLARLVDSGVEGSGAKLAHF